MQLRLFSDISHKRFVTYLHPVPKEVRAARNALIMFEEVFGITNYQEATSKRTWRIRGIRNT